MFDRSEAVRRMRLFMTQRRSILLGLLLLSLTAGRKLAA